MIIAIDGPAASGKSTVAREVARRLEFQYIDTGAMYRAVTWKAINSKIDTSNKDALVALARNSEIEMSPLSDNNYTIKINGEDVTEAIRTPKVTGSVSAVAKVPGVRTALVKKQRSYATKYPDLVVEGRDIGTAVFPDAEVKIFLRASAVERARRRYEELKVIGHDIELPKVERDLLKRDNTDSTRAVNPLKKAQDAYALDTTEKTIDQVVDEILDIANKKR
ncbi:MAG: (d)CMP kinase [Rubrobacteridae bacterium]|nr:(d)CMP kinase [Rubrobacteridae bacterium]